MQMIRWWFERLTPRHLVLVQSRQLSRRRGEKAAQTLMAAAQDGSLQKALAGKARCGAQCGSVWAVVWAVQGWS